MQFIINSEHDKQRAIDWIKSMPYGHEVFIQEYKPSRSRAQNRTFHMWVKIIADYMGEKLEDIKDRIVLSVFDPVIKEVKTRRNGKEVTYTLAHRKSTAKMSKSEFSELMAKTQIAGNFLNLTLPIPDEYKEIK